MGGHDDTGVEDLDESAMADDLDALTGEGGPDPIGEPGEADGASLVDPTGHPRGPDRRHRHRRRIVGDVDDGAASGGSEAEPLDR